MKRNIGRGHWLFTTMLLLEGSHFAYAQAVSTANALPPASRAHAGIEEVTVTAQKRSQKLQNVPVAITALSTREIARSGITNATSLARHVASLSISTGGGGAVLPFLRGVGNPDSVVGNESSVAIYLDDVYVSRLTTSFLELTDISRIEVLKGPQGTLFGRNASAGVINIVTKEPSNTFQGDASVGYGNYNTTIEKLYLTGPVAPHVTANVSALNSWQGSGFGRDFTNGRPLGYSDPTLVKSKWTFDLTPTTILKLEGDYEQSSSDFGVSENEVYGTTFGSPDWLSLPPFNQKPIQYKPTPGFYDGIGAGQYGGHKRGFGFSARLSQDLGFAQLSSITGYRQDAEDYHTDGSYSPQPSLEYELSSHERTFSEEVNITSKQGSPFDWIVGAYYLNEFSSYEPTKITGPGLATDVLGGAFGPILPAGTQIDLFSHQRTKDYAVYTQETVHLPYKINLTGGVRYTIDDLDGAGSTVAVIPGLFTGALGSQANAVQFSKVTFKGGVDYHVTDDALTYFSVSRGFKAGTYNLLPFAVPATQPEVLTDFEIGAKTTFFNNRLQLNGALFYYDYKDPQVQEVANHLIFLANAKAASVKGVDLEGQYVFSSALSTHFGFEYLDSHYTDFPNAPYFAPNPNPPYGAIQSAGSADGNQLPEAPKFAFNVGFNYEFVSSFGKFDFNENYAFDGSLRLTPDNFIRQKSYGLLDASLTYMLPDSDRWELRLWGKNITGTHYYEGGQENSGAAGFVYIPGAPALYGALLTYHFGG